MTTKLFKRGCSSFVFSLMLLTCGGNLAVAQYHTLSLPEESPFVQQTQQLGITNISVSYHSPAVRGRKIWGNVVPMNGDPMPWRAGANENTKVSFSTNVTVGGKPLARGSYGLQTIPGETEWVIIFTKNDNMWGSYYYDSRTDDALRINLKPKQADFSEWLVYEFTHRTDSTIALALRWENVSVEIPIAIDLNETVTEQFRYELSGHLNMSWAAWNEAAKWCLKRNFNYDEALAWVNRSIEGGYQGYMASRNFENLSTKERLLVRLGKDKDAQKTFSEALELGGVEELYEYMYFMFEEKRFDQALTVARKNVQKNDGSWISHLGLARALSATNRFDEAVKEMKRTIALAPANRKPRFEVMLKSLEEGKRII